MSPQKTQLMVSQILPIIQDYNIDYAAIFGSYARGEENAQSDLDLLVHFSSPVSYFDIFDIEKEISKKTKIKKVDLVTKDALHPSIKKYVQKDLKVIYDARR